MPSARTAEPHDPPRPTRRPTATRPTDRPTDRLRPDHIGPTDRYVQVLYVPRYWYGRVRTNVPIVGGLFVVGEAPPAPPQPPAKSSRVSRHQGAGAGACAGGGRTRASVRNRRRVLRSRETITTCQLHNNNCNTLISSKRMILTTS